MDLTAWGIEEAKLIVTSVITVVAAGFGIAIQMSMKKIADRQAATARQAIDVAAAKLKLDLFERRMAIFEQAWIVIGRAALGNSYDYATLADLQNKLHEAGFLFGNDVEEYLLNLRSRAIDEQTLLIQIKKEGMHVDQSVQDRHKELQDWFLQEAKNIRVPFLPYMSFEKWRA